jgi:hypothetical protein
MCGSKGSQKSICCPQTDSSQCVHGGNIFISSWVKTYTFLFGMGKKSVRKYPFSMVKLKKTKKVSTA